MSFLSRLLGKTPPAESAAQAPLPENKELPPQPDPATRLAEEEASLAQALAAADMAAVGRWVLEGSSTRVRQTAAAAIEDMDQLHELIRATRHGKDKAVYRILTSKRDERLAEVRRAEQQQADLELVAAAIARHARLPHSSTYAATLAQLEARWHALEPHARGDLQAEVTAQLATAQQVIQEHLRAAEAEAEAERERAAALARKTAERQQELEARAAAAAAADEDHASTETTPVAEPVVADQADAGESGAFAAPAENETEAARRRDLVGLLRRAQAALGRGGTARAARLRDQLKEKLLEAPPLPPWFERQLQQLEARLEELQDWKTFRVEPKRAELVHRMQGLIGADLSPEELARHVRRLRDEWRTLNRGAGDEPSPEWQQFQEAAARAYEPCREHFARQAELRRENQAKREALLERLETLVTEQNPESPDWRAMQRMLSEARNEWRRYAPVEQSVVKPLQERFHALLKPLQARLDDEYDRNVQVRRELIARAEGLLKLEDTRQAMQDAKGLQQEWKAAGPVRRKQSDALWEEFRRHCDAVFQRSSQEAAAYSAALEANVAGARALCEELETLAGHIGEQNSQGLQRLDAIRDEFAALELPRGVARELRRRIADADDRCRDALRRQHKAAARRSWSEVFAVSAQVRACALAVLAGRNAEDLAAMRDAAAAALAGLEHAPKDVRSILEQQLAAVTARSFSEDLAANEAALRLLCVRSELASGMPTPPEDEELRRDYQMQRLVESMGQGQRPAPAELGELAREWLAVGPVESAAHEELLARFLRCQA